MTSSIFELVFDSPEDMQQGLESAEAQATIADLPNFTAEDKTETALVEEVTII